MNAFSKFISGLNSRQRYGLFVGVAVSLLLFAFHNPIQGYAGNCAAAYTGSPEFAPVVLASDLVESWYQCKSNGAVFETFAMVASWLFAEAIVIAITLLWLWIFGIHEKDKR